jgi:hypothetical protein
MKIVVRLAVVVVTLLMVSNFVLAQPCDQEFCYEITTTNQNGTKYPWTMYVCLYNDGTGYACADSDCGELSLFGGGPGWPNTTGAPQFGANPNWTTWLFRADGGDNIGFLQPMGAGGVLITGEGSFPGLRYTIKGQKVPLSNCQA